MRVEPVAEQLQGLGPQLGDARLGDAQLGGDLRHRPLLEEVPLDDDAQARRQALDRVVQVADPLAVQQQVLRAGGALADQVVGAGGEALQAQYHGPLHVLVDRLQLVHRDAERLGQLQLGRGTPEGGGQLLLGGVDPAGPAAYRAAGPVQPAQLVEQGTPDAGGGEGAERGTPAGVEALGGTGQRGHPGRDQVVPADVGRYPAEQLTDEVADQRQVSPDQVFQRPRLGLRASGHRFPPRQRLTRENSGCRRVLLRSPSVAGRLHPRPGRGNP
ncbi:MAG: hypothetical protein AUG44_00335 [Actinobacteria bacterium 13_1_20CM_3_71_11]|nr:MAG: hypothetical protein AUG44_00335 [Actinobacteria bacterium 13_1_20CM_3_71_11]